MVRAGRGGVFADEFVREDFVAIGWEEAGDPTAVRDRIELVSRFARTWPDATEQSRFVGASVVFRFVTELALGDEVITYDPGTRIYSLGKIVGAAIWTGIEHRATRRAVQWTGSVARDQLSASSRAKLGSIVTLFLVGREPAEELRRLASGRADVPSTLPSSDADAAAEAPPIEILASIEEQAVERIKDRIARLDWEQMQELVAALLRAMGYRTHVSPRGADRGRDILATTDGFGFKPPRIFVEVKHRPREAMGAPQVRAMPVGSLADDRGLFVSTGGFTREAYYEAERSQRPISLMTLDDLTRAILDAYPSFDEVGRSLLPLQRVYWPID
ncbi:hypothetical protein IP88_06445 [alpha proteobacterium AAP81b]|nr:hypothetical protein IP88_06445 [alpha proteobacterium AAP81b]